MGVNAAFFTKFRKVVVMIGSDREHERHAAADQAYRLCDENDLSVAEAAEGAFGTPNNDDLQQRIDELEEDNRQLAEAVNVLNAQQHEIPGDAGQQLFKRIWSYPQARLIFLLFGGWAFAVCMSFCEFACDYFHKGLSHCWGFFIVAILLVHWWGWAIAEFTRFGAGVVVLKAVVIVGGIGFVLAYCANDAWSAGITMTIVCLLTITNGARWLADQMQHSDDEIFATLRSWFA